MSKISLKHSGGNVVSLNSPTSAPTSADVAFKLPNQDGSASEALITDGSGNLSFAGTGKILQVKNAIKTDTASNSSTTFADISGLSISITPSSSSNKILFRGYVAMGTQLNGQGTLKIFRDSTEIGKSTADGTAANNSTGTFKVLNAGSVTTTGRSQIWQVHFEVLDSPATTSATTYKVQFAELHINATLYVNRSYAGTSSDHHGVISSVTAMEVAA